MVSITVRAHCESYVRFFKSNRVNSVFCAVDRVVHKVILKEKRHNNLTWFIKLLKLAVTMLSIIVICKKI